MLQLEIFLFTQPIIVQRGLSPTQPFAITAVPTVKNYFPPDMKDDVGVF